jgi:hypothetical protein
MRSEMPGADTLAAEVSGVTRNGIWLLVCERELFMPFDEFPWFRGASLESVFNVELAHRGHLRWPELDIDLAVESIEHPERYPLVSQLPASETIEGRPIVDS